VSRLRTGKLGQEGRRQMQRASPGLPKIASQFIHATAAYGGM
jgi:hypothetical protein